MNEEHTVIQLIQLWTNYDFIGLRTFHSLNYLYYYIIILLWLEKKIEEQTRKEAKRTKRFATSKMSCHVSKNNNQKIISQISQHGQFTLLPYQSKVMFRFYNHRQTNYNIPVFWLFCVLSLWVKMAFSSHSAERFKGLGMNIKGNKGRFCINSYIATLTSKRLSVENKAKLSQLIRADFALIAKFTH